ncbi:hypothetical protein GCM10029992_59630 [Glycomyces albus]
MSVLVFAGASQFATMGIMTTGGGLVAGVAAGLILNLRHVPYGMAVGEVYWTSLRSKLVGSHLLIDQTTAFALAAGDDRRRAKTAFWTVGITLFLVWNAGTVIGALAGQFIADPATLGLDAALPAILLALVVPALRDKSTLAAGLVGSAIALGTSFFLPAGVPVLLALAGLAVMWRPRGRGGRRVRMLAAIIALAVGTYLIRIAGPCCVGASRCPSAPSSSSRPARPWCCWP